MKLPTNIYGIIIPLDEDDPSIDPYYPAIPIQVQIPNGGNFRDSLDECGAIVRGALESNGEDYQHATVLWQITAECTCKGTWVKFDYEDGNLTTEIVK